MSEVIEEQEAPFDPEKVERCTQWYDHMAVGENGAWVKAYGYDRLLALYRTALKALAEQVELHAVLRREMDAMVQRVKADEQP